ncbi:hypothetical protein [Leptolyngbya sp. PCC 6406]|uniref:hypothetical protein n=1 Tax=Leptolyngbya sp. PCC 6406 TaxID=1173264 RepID=UPI0002AC433E|nr:hypothetical protein [Leptolyngbya sp. PCC 6406]
MNPALSALFDEPEKRYLQPNELNVLSQYVGSLPERIAVYRQLRDEELTLMQQVADTLQQQFPQESEDLLKRSIQNGLLALRYAAMALLTDDTDLVTRRLQSWLPDMVEAYGTLAIDQALHALLTQQLSRRFTAPQMALLTPGLAAAKAMLNPTHAVATDTTDAPLVGMF